MVSALAWSQEDEPFDVELDGRKTWTVRYGFGNPLGLASSGLSSGQLSLEQTLAVDIVGTALSVLTLEAHFDDQLSEQMQSMTVRLDTERLDGVFGDFLVTGFESYTAFGRKMKGLRLDYTLGTATLTAIASRLEGVAKTLVFVGETAESDVMFAGASLTDPDKPMPYARNIAGFYAFPLETLYVPEFSEVGLRFDVSEGLDGMLERYGLAYLAEVLRDKPGYDLESREFLVAGNDAQILLLAKDAIVLVRDRLETAIDIYNDEYKPDGSDDAKYPFAQGTDYEKAFLEEVAEYVALDVDGEIHPLTEEVRAKYYRLGRDDVVPGSVVVSISFDQTSFQAIGAPAYPDYTFKLYPEEGVIALDFPVEFFEADGAVRVSFDYAVTGGAFSLGLSVIPGSERVTLNGELLERDTDYEIDYELGMVFLLSGIGETDVVQIDYELYSGGLGAAGSYATYLYGLQLDWDVSDVLDLTVTVLQAAEDPGSIADPAAAATMPNRHTLAAVSGTVKLDDLDADFLIGMSNDRFPFDDNARAHTANEISSIAVAGDYVLFGHRGGLTVLDGAGWSTYGVGNGLAGRVVTAIEGDRDRAYVGTASGLTVIELEGDAPFDRVMNWVRHTESHGLPASAIGALLIEEETLWIGTSSGLVSAKIEDLTEGGAPMFTLFESVGEVEITALERIDETLYVGTTEGVYACTSDGEATLLVGSGSDAVLDLLAVDGALYVASGRGLRGYQDGVGVGWLEVGRSVEALGSLDGDLIYATPGEVVNARTGERILVAVAVTAISRGGGAVWLGSRANDDFELALWRLGTKPTAFGSDVTGVSGEDPFGYTDTEAAEHTVQGATAQASFRHSSDGFSIGGMFDTTAPSYRSLGRLSRSDSLGWDIASTIDLLGSSRLSLTHAYRLDDASADESAGRMVNSISFSGSFGPQIRLVAQQESLNESSLSTGPESGGITLSFTMSDSLLADALGLTLSWKDGYAWTATSDDVRRTTRLGAGVDLAALPGLVFGLDWSRPLTVYGETRRGTETFSWNTAWEMETGFGDLEIEHDSGWARRYGETSGAWEHAIGFDLGVDGFGWGSWQHTPRFDLQAKYEDLAGNLDARATIRSMTEGISIQTVVQGELDGIGEPVLRRNARLSSTVTYSGLETLTASLTAAVDRSDTIYLGESKATAGLSMTGRMTWTPESGHYDVLSFSWRSSGEGEARRVTGTLNNTYRLDWVQFQRARQESPEAAEEIETSAYPTVVLQADTSANLQRMGDDVRFDGSITARLDAAFSQTWSAGVSASYLMGMTSDVGFYHSVLLEATVAIDF